MHDDRRRRRYPAVSTGLTNRGTPRVEHGLSSGCAHVGGRGCVHCVCNYGSMLQVSRSTQKLLALPQVSEQNHPGRDPSSQHPL